MNKMVELTEEELMKTTGGLGRSQFGNDFAGTDAPAGGRPPVGGGGGNYLSM